MCVCVHPPFTCAGRTSNRSGMPIANTPHRFDWRLSAGGAFYLYITFSSLIQQLA